MSLADIKAKLLARQNDPLAHAKLMSQQPEDWDEAYPNGTYNVFCYPAHWGVSYTRYYNYEIPITIDWDDEICPLEKSPFDVRLGNPAKYEKNLEYHQIIPEVRDFLVSHEMPHELFWFTEIEGPSTLIVRLTNEKHRLHFWIRFSENTTFPE